MTSIVERVRGSPRSVWVAAAAVAALVGVGGAVMVTRFLKADHARTVRKRAAQQKHRELMGDLNEARGVLGYIDLQELPKAQRLADEAEQVMQQLSQVGNEAKAEAEIETAVLEARLQAIRREIAGVGEQLLRLMERIDGVAPALVVEAAGLEPWAEHEPELKAMAEAAGLAAVFVLADDLRSIRKGLIRKAERRARKVDQLKKIAAVAV
ncbi:hypothetical protein FBU59_001442 [Linderina macrospora]|uniref:Uncharacterized protein n=1 Tax=Linderina macrospora TaxID=4868 RepID=A0ACC1JDU6_9FUNG|nr:hypothetical protein FBU59_001442 [Linderina macrospora]